MSVPKEVQDILENQIQLMINQTKAYRPFIRLAFPNVSDLSDVCFTLIVGNVLPIFVTQYAMRMKYPTEKDFAEFTTITEKYREKIKSMFE